VGELGGYLKVMREFGGAREEEEVGARCGTAVSKLLLFFRYRSRKVVRAFQVFEKESGRKGRGDFFSK